MRPFKPVNEVNRSKKKWALPVWLFQPSGAATNDPEPRDKIPEWLFSTRAAVRAIDSILPSGEEIRAVTRRTGSAKLGRVPGSILGSAEIDKNKVFLKLQLPF